MKKFFYLASIAVAALVMGCTAGEEGDEIQQEEYTPATLTIEPAALNVAKTKGATATATITSDSEVLSVVVDYSAASWLSAKLEGTTLTVTTTAANPNPVTRDGIVHVSAGEGINTTTVDVTVTQALEDEIAPTLTLGAKEAKLTSAKDALAIISYESNMTDVTVAVAEDGKAWLKAEKDDKNITLTALSANESSAERSTTVTVTAKNTKGTTVSETIAVTQAQKPAEGTISIGATVEGGVLFWISEDSKQGKVLYPYGEKLAWSPKVINDASADVPDAINAEDGTVNVAAMKAFATANNVDFAATFPAAAYCDNIAGGGWYLPARNELVALFEAYNGTEAGKATVDNHENITAAELAARTAFEGYILACAADGVILDIKKTSGDSAFSSTQQSPTNAYYIRWGKYDNNHGGKHSTARYARCIKVVNL